MTKGKKEKKKSGGVRLLMPASSHKIAQKKNFNECNIRLLSPIYLLFLQDGTALATPSRLLFRITCVPRAGVRGLLC